GGDGRDDNRRKRDRHRQPVHGPPSSRASRVTPYPDRGEVSGGGGLLAPGVGVEGGGGINNLGRGALEGEGHEVEQAFDGRTALASVQRRTPDLVILDWMLPDLDGLVVCRRLREEYLMPIIMLTARTEEVDRVLGLEVGADDYVPKPFSMR